VYQRESHPARGGFSRLKYLLSEYSLVVVYMQAPGVRGPNGKQLSVAPAYIHGVEYMALVLAKNGDSGSSLDGGRESYREGAHGNQRTPSRPRATVLRALTGLTLRGLLTHPCSLLSELGGCDSLLARGESTAGGRMRPHPRPLFPLPPPRIFPRETLP